MIDYKKKYLKYKQKYLLAIKGGFIDNDIKISKEGLTDVNAPYIDDTFTCKQQKNIIICKDIKLKNINQKNIIEYECPNRDTFTYKNLNFEKSEAINKKSNFFIIPALTTGNSNNNKKLLIYIDHMDGQFLWTTRIHHFPGHIIQIRDPENKYFYNFIEKPVKRLKEYIDTHNIEEITIMGYSLGGTGALYFSKYFKEALCISVNPQIITNWAINNYSFHKLQEEKFSIRLNLPYNIRKEIANTETKTYILVDIAENTQRYWGDTLHAGNIPKNENINIIQFDVVGHSQLMRELLPQKVTDNNFLINLINLKHNELKINKTLLENVSLANDTSGILKI